MEKALSVLPSIIANPVAVGPSTATVPTSVPSAATSETVNTWSEAGVGGYSCTVTVIGDEFMEG